MNTFHFVDDYERHVDQLIRNHPLSEAMSLAVGGYYEEFSVILAELLVQNGLRDGMTLVDLGCGSGRAAKGISKRVQIEYLGTDVVQRLLDYAAKVCPKHYRFKCHRELSVPAPDSSADMVCAFSLFTHLLHEESPLISPFLRFPIFKLPFPSSFPLLFTTSPRRSCGLSLFHHLGFLKKLDLHLAFLIIFIVL
jgi:SAM-dependent methyltransferase